MGKNYNHSRSNNIVTDTSLPFYIERKLSINSYWGYLFFKLKWLVSSVGNFGNKRWKERRKCRPRDRKVWIFVISFVIWCSIFSFRFLFVSVLALRSHRLIIIISLRLIIVVDVVYDDVSASFVASFVNAKT